MNSVRCPDCGLSNWSTAESCKRCGGELLASVASSKFIPAKSSSKASTSFGKKWLLTLFLIAIPLVFWQYIRTRDEAIVLAIQNSVAFSQPVTVDAYMEVNAFGGVRASFEALTLRDAGFLNIEERTKEVPDPRQPLFPPSVVSGFGPWSQRDPWGNFIGSPQEPIYRPRLVKVTTLEFSFREGADTSDWKPFEKTNPHQTGWTVPIGQRELVELTAVEWMSNTPLVYFTWKWKPNEAGRHFDSSGDPPQFSGGVYVGNNARPKASSQISSATLHRATARLLKAGTGWEVKEITWHN